MRYHGDSESSASEPDTTGDEDFVAEDFFVSNKKLEKSPAVQRRFRDDLGIRRSPTPQPVRPVSMIDQLPCIVQHLRKLQSRQTFGFGVEFIVHSTSEKEQ